MVWVPEHMGMNGNETDNEFARQRSSHSLTGPEPALVYPQRLPGRR